jgi:hypothetical protein
MYEIVAFKGGGISTSVTSSGEGFGRKGKGSEKQKGELNASY